MSIPSSFAPVTAVTGIPIRLAMQRLWLTGEVLPAGARLVVQHVFQCDEARPLEVIYAFPLPRDSSLRRFRITGDGFETDSELKETEDAVKAYEQGIADGSLSVLARQYGDGIVNLTVGNIRPKETMTVYLELLAGVELRDDGFRFRFPLTLAPAYHAGMRAVAIGDEGEMEMPTGEFGDVILPRFHRDASSLHEVGFDLSVMHQLPLAEIGSPSHSIRVKQSAGQPTRITLALEKEVPNRDFVLDIRFQTRQAQVLAGPGADGKQSFAVVVPSTQFGSQAEAPRRIAILLDRSSSMQGAPIAQARTAIEACLAVLTEQDSFLVLAFDDRVEGMHPMLVPATGEQRERARAFLKEVDARGGTELAMGLREAARVLGSHGDIFLITDGQVFGTEDIIAQARTAGIRLFCLGIGSASQDRFLALLARETGGISRFATARERVDLAAVDLFASMGPPAASGVKATGVQPEPPLSVFAGTPVLLLGEMEIGSSESVDVIWDGGKVSLEVPPGDAATGEAVRLLRGARLITDWESRYPAEEAVAPLETRRQSRVAARLLELSKAFGLTSREMSLVAVIKRSGDQIGELPDTRVVPVGIPQDTEFSAYFDRPAYSRGPAKQILQASSDRVRNKLLDGIQFVLVPEPVSCGPLFNSRLPRSKVSRSKATNADLVDLAAMLEADGGMAGGNLETRVARTVAAILTFAAAGHTLTAGAFRLHVARLVRFLKSLSIASESEGRVITTAIEAASTGRVPTGEWLSLARESTQWKEIEAVLMPEIGATEK